ncbi:2382_t:CDS:2 [Paraglomus occultum]|uniref:2382_t:CDS:1 n=1 Tax=Paraglomus occultum TaxID=144539 RepID=A0A9N8VNG5_9GLOM|nr:2382_t:CDS:2 [Paraglomus occultum]
MGGCCSLIRRKKYEQSGSKFKVIDGRRFQILDDSNYTLPNDAGEEERLDIQHFVLKHAFNGNFSAPVDQLLRKGGARVLDVGCGSGIWTFELAKEYPKSHFVGIDLAPVNLKDEKLSNVEFIEYNVLDGLPFESNSFDYVFARALVAVYTRSQWTELAIPEYTRIIKPGGWLELMEWDTVLKGGAANVKRMNNALIGMCDQKDLIAAPGYEIQSFLEQSGHYTNIGYEQKPVPIGPKGEKYAEMAIRDWRDVWQGLKLIFSSVMQVSGEHYDAISEAAVGELIKSGVIWENMRAWGQKKDRIYTD